ncbi:MAG: hypothetical protein ACI90V_003406 [Bacillariaceae sp.]
MQIYHLNQLTAKMRVEILAVMKVSVIN